MTRRIALLTTLLVLAAAAPAGAQGGAFGPLPPAATPTPPPAQLNTGSGGDTDKTVLFIIGGALILGFAVMGWYIMRDARAAAPKAQFAGAGLREDGPHKHKKQAKSKARAKGRAQRNARKAHRRR